MVEYESEPEAVTVLGHVIQDDFKHFVWDLKLSKRGRTITVSNEHDEYFHYDICVIQTNSHRCAKSCWLFLYTQAWSSRY